MAIWHRGTAIEITPGMTLDEQIKKAGLDWEIKLQEHIFAAPGFDPKPSGRFEAYRSDTGELIDIYGSRRQPFQNRDVVESFHAYCEANDLTMNYLGKCKEGKAPEGTTIYAAAKLPSDFNLDVAKKGDIVEAFVILKESHLNGCGMVVTLYTNRLVCTNGMTRSVCSNQIIHHIGAFNRDRVTQSLQNALDELNQYKAIANGLAEVAVSKEEATLQLIRAYGDAKKFIETKSLEGQPQIVQTCLKLFGGEGIGSDYLSAYGTAFGLMEAVKEYFNHHVRQVGGVSGSFSSLCFGSKAEKQRNFERQLCGVYLR